MSSGNVSDGGPATVTMNVPSVWFACASTALHRTVVAPPGNVEPEAGLHVGVIAPSTLSSAVATYVTSAVSVAMLSGSVSDGATVSVTNTLNLPWTVPKESLA